MSPEIDYFWRLKDRPGNKAQLFSVIEGNVDSRLYNPVVGQDSEIQAFTLKLTQNKECVQNFGKQRLATLKKGCGGGCNIKFCLVEIGCLGVG